MFSNLSLTANAGELIHLAGANGTGKSTCMSIMAGLLAPHAGSVTVSVDGSDSDDRRDHLEYLPAEANGLLLKMDATQNLRFWASLRGRHLSRDEVFAALAPWNLNHPLLRDDFAVEKFSTGMKRRLALARLALSPVAGWLLDEPLYGLDTQATTTFTGMLGAHLKKGGFAIVISHDLKPIDSLITRTITLGASSEGLTPAGRSP